MSLEIESSEYVAVTPNFLVSLITVSHVSHNYHTFLSSLSLSLSHMHMHMRDGEWVCVVQWYALQIVLLRVWDCACAALHF